MPTPPCIVNIDRTRRELKPHGTPEFPCAGYVTRYTAAPDSCVPWHWHEEMELWLVASGTARVRVPSKTLLLRAGDCVAFNAGTLHCGDTDDHCEIRALVFSPRLIAGAEDSVFSTRYMRPLTRCAAFDTYRFDAEEIQTAREVCARAFAALEAEAPDYEFEVREALTRVCMLLFRRFAPDAGEAAPPDRDAERLRAMLDFIHENYERPIALCEIARAANISQRECLRCFGRALRMSPVQFLIQFRVMRGAQLLREQPDLSVSQVAAACGFDSPSNFSRTFRRFFGVSPRAYRSRAVGDT